MERRKIGDFFVERSVLTLEEKNHVLEYAHQSGKSFGEAGLELGLLKREDMIRVFGPSFEIDFFYLDPRYFPANSRDALTLPEILRYGALPLGFKTVSGFLSRKRIANVGFLDPGNAAGVEAVRRIVRERLGKEGVADIKIFLLLADQFMDVLRETYGQGRSQLRSLDASALDPVLALSLAD